MPLFSSDRERRLWAWTLAVVAAIYSTLGLATTLVGVLSNRGLFDRTFVVAFVLIGAAIVTLGLKTRPRAGEIGVVLGVAAVYLMVFARMGIQERSHLFEYGVVAVFIHEALTERASQGRRERGAGLGAATDELVPPLAVGLAHLDGLEELHLPAVIQLGVVLAGRGGCLRRIR